MFSCYHDIYHSISDLRWHTTYLLTCNILAHRSTKVHPSATGGSQVPVLQQKQTVIAVSNGSRERPAEIGRDDGAHSYTFSATVLMSNTYLKAATRRVAEQHFDLWPGHYREQKPDALQAVKEQVGNIVFDRLQIARSLAAGSENLYRPGRLRQWMARFTIYQHLLEELLPTEGDISASPKSHHSLARPNKGNIDVSHCMQHHLMFHN